MKSLTIGGVGATNVDDVLKVALNQISVALDCAASDRLAKDEPKKFEQEPTPTEPAAATSNILSETETRAVLFVRAVTLASGRTGVRR